MTRTARPRYRMNADSWTVLRDILSTPPEGGKPSEFNADSASLRGRLETHPESGWMTGDTLALFAGHRASGAIDYVIYSYGTPIAYRVTQHIQWRNVFVSTWIVPDDRYSVTTSKHHGRVRFAISQLGD